LGIRFKKYRSGRALGAALESYFQSISRVVPVMEETRSTDAATGKAVVRLEPVYNSRGEQITRLDYPVPPSVPGICRALNILRPQWQAYCDGSLHPETAKAAQWAMLMIEDYLVTELLSRSKGADGLKVVLQEVLAGREHRESEQGGPASPAAVDMGEKLRLLRELFAGSGG
jgi:hypothetical protein